jgi:hypothetical protein
MQHEAAYGYYLGSIAYGTHNAPLAKPTAGRARPRCRLVPGFDEDRAAQRCAAPFFEYGSPRDRPARIADRTSVVNNGGLTAVSNRTAFVPLHTSVALRLAHWGALTHPGRV